MKRKATYWKIIAVYVYMYILWTEEPGGLSTGSQRVRHNEVT